MKHKKYLFIVFLLAFVVNAQTKKVYLADIEGDIDLGLAPFVSRVINEAQKGFADAVIFRINTFGGRVDAATQIKDAILESKVLTIAFIDKRAISAGALIALSCQKIAMVPGSSMGATTVVDQTGQKQSEKYQSYMRSEMRATAEKNGRRTDIAEGMVDERVVVKGLVDSTRLITLTAEEALKYKMTDTIVTNINQLLAAFDLGGAEIIRYNANWAEDLVRFLTNPIVSSILIMIGLIGLYTEIKTPGWGLPGTIGLIALALFFGSSYILNLASVIEILLFVVGVVLLAIEVFVIPGFGLAGIIGIILMIAALFLSLLSSTPFIDFDLILLAIIQLGGALLLTIIIAYLLSKVLPKWSAFSRLVLADRVTAKTGYTSPVDIEELLGHEGAALTPLRPAGTAEINGKRIDVVTEGDFIEKGSKIKVLKVEGLRIIVKRIS